jgi:hypothetical protein
MSICLAFSEIDWALTKDVFAVVGSIASACGVVAAVIYGAIGLSTWRRQAKGSNDHDLSKRILLSLFRYREAINRVRFPSFRDHELQIETVDQEKLNYEVARFRQSAKAYSQRLNDVIARRSELNVELVEGNALWGKKLTDLLHGVDDLEEQLFSYVNNYLWATNPEHSNATREAFHEQLAGKPNILYDDLSKDGDDYRKSMNSEISTIQDFLISKMIR